ncbi:hypothetical protein SNEBB_001455, partial [Seison nebaliae]
MSEEELDQDLITAQELLDKSKELLVDAEQELEDQINEKTYHPSTTETNVQRELEDTNSSFINAISFIHTFLRSLVTSASHYRKEHSGSNRSYITKGISLKIAKSTGRTGNLSINSFNGNRTNLEEVPIVIASLEKDSIALNVKVFEVEFIGRLSIANIPIEVERIEKLMNIREASDKIEIDGYRMVPMDTNNITARNERLKKKFLTKRSSEYGDMNIKHRNGLLTVATRFAEAEEQE